MEDRKYDEFGFGNEALVEAMGLSWMRYIFYAPIPRIKCVPDGVHFTSKV